MTTWDPAQYLKFADERARPAFDLLARVDALAVGPPTGGTAPWTVFDLGCGPGNVTALLRRRWPGASVIGVDSSEAMLANARANHPEIEFVAADLATFRPPAPADAIVSNAALHWLPEHAGLFPALGRALAPGGVLAVQMPMSSRQASHTLMAESAQAGPWRAKASAALPRFSEHEPADYYGWLAPLCRTVDIWETVYLHALAGEDAVVEWIKGAALRPVLAVLDQGERAGFLADYRARVARAYPRLADGTTLYPFRRLFIVAVK
ncbi:MAG: methyltransferase domain-containing protein [Pseudomonadota bacterium]